MNSSDLIIYNLIVLVCGYLYVLLIIGIGIFLQKKANKTSEFTRKIIHVFAGFVIYTVFIFTPNFAWMAVIIAITFIILIWLSGPTGPEFMKAIFSSMARENEIEEGKIYGPLYYAISITILTAIFTFPLLPLVSFYWIPASCLSIMYLGDGIAPFIGRKFGGNHHFGSNNRTYVGSLSVFLFGVIGCHITMFTAYFLTQFGISSQNLTINIFIPLISIITAGVFTVIEAITPKGYDNITCPLTSTFMLALVSTLVLPVMPLILPI